MQPTTLKTKDQIRFGDTVAQFQTMRLDDNIEPSHYFDAVDISNTSTMSQGDVEECQTVLVGNEEVVAQVVIEIDDSESTLPYNCELESVGGGSTIDLRSSRESAASSELNASDRKAEVQLAGRFAQYNPNPKADQEERANCDDSEGKYSEQENLITQFESSALLSAPAKEMKFLDVMETQPMMPLGASSPLPSSTKEPKHSYEILQSTSKEDCSDEKKSAAVCNNLKDFFDSLSKTPFTSTHSNSNEKHEQRSPSKQPKSQMTSNHCADNSWSIDETTPDLLPDLPSESQYGEILELINETQPENESAVLLGPSTDEDNSEIQQEVEKPKEVEVMVPEKKKKYRIMKYGSDDEGPDVKDLTKGPKTQAAVTQNIDKFALSSIYTTTIKSETKTAASEIKKPEKKSKLRVVIARMKWPDIAKKLEKSNH